MDSSDRVACEEMVAGACSAGVDGIYLAGYQCSQRYVLCQQNDILAVRSCLPNTLFDETRQACYDLPEFGACTSLITDYEPAYSSRNQGPIERDPRQIKFLVYDTGDSWSTGPQLEKYWDAEQ